jgi:hypothetical protein
MLTSHANIMIVLVLWLVTAVTYDRRESDQNEKPSKMITDKILIGITDKKVI